MNHRIGLDRRKFLRGIGAAVGLPAMESLSPVMAATTDLATTAKGSPLRMAYLY
ncbi:MAG: hypothetical protein ACJA1W_004180, partial [Akkermansiaceae bacterium]